jgi:hypothetical protein
MDHLARWQIEVPRLAAELIPGGWPGTITVAAAILGVLYMATERVFEESEFSGNRRSRQELELSLR